MSDEQQFYAEITLHEHGEIDREMWIGPVVGEDADVVAEALRERGDDVVRVVDVDTYIEQAELQRAGDDDATFDLER